VIRQEKSLPLLLWVDALSELKAATIAFATEKNPIVNAVDVKNTVRENAK